MIDDIEFYTIGSDVWYLTSDGGNEKLDESKKEVIAVLIDRIMECYPDAYEAILQAERNGLITILRYEEMSEAMREWNARTIKEEYEKAVDHPEYRHFLRGNFPDMIKG